jgi:4-amino-4-deoxy-L-arabinose transferase-like glycosyltransferase
MKQRLNQWEKPILLGLIASFSLLAIGFSLGPIFEGPDEIEHYRFVRYLQYYQSLPELAGQPYGQFHQAPLYYLLILPFASVLPDADFAEIDGRLNPYHGYQFEQVGNDNKNLYLHHRDESFPYASQTAVAVHSLRFISVFLGIGTVCISYRIFCLLWPENIFRRLLALAILVFWPQFIFISSVLNNDNLAFFWASLTLYLLLYQQQNGVTWRGASLLGLVLGLALLTKASLALLALPVGIATIFDKRKWKTAPLSLIITLIIAAWWYLRAYLSYGDFLGVNAMWQTWPDLALTESKAMDLGLGLQRLPYVYQSLWARFGSGSVAVASWLYSFFDIRLLAAGIGLLGLAYWKREDWQKNPKWRLQSLIVFVFAFTWLGSALSSSSVASAGNQGRYLFPGITAWSSILALGLETWFYRFPKLQSLLFSIFVFGIVSLISLFGYFYPAYQTLAVPASISQPLQIRYENAAELIGMSLPPTAEAGETIRIELYWRALAPVSPDLQTYVHTAFAENVLWRDSIPALGLRPADDWLAGETWAESYQFTIPRDSLAGTEYLIVAGFYEPTTGESLMAYDAKGQEIDKVPVIAIVEIVE